MAKAKGHQSTYYSTALTRGASHKAHFTDRVSSAAIVRHALDAWWAGNASFIEPVFEQILTENGVGPTVTRRIFGELVAEGVLSDVNNPSRDPAGHVSVPRESALVTALRPKLEAVSRLRRRDIDAALHAFTGLEQGSDGYDEARVVREARQVLEGIDRLEPPVVNRMLETLEDALRPDEQAPTVVEVREALESTSLPRAVINRMMLAFDGDSEGSEAGAA